MEIITIGNKNFSHFELILTAEAVERLTPGPGRQEDTFALGITDEDMPLGAIAIKCSPPTAEVISLYVVEQYRRLGIGAKLLFEAITDTMTLPGISEFIVPYSELPGEDVYTSFFRDVGMDVIDVGAEYRVKAEDALASGPLSGRPRQKVMTQSWNELLISERKKLFMEGAGLYDYSVQGKLREDLVFVAMDKYRRNYRGCIAVVEEEGELILAWLRAEKSPFLMIELIRRVLKKLEENGEQFRVIRIPTINSVSDAIVKDLFTDSLTLEYYSRRAVFDFTEE